MSRAENLISLAADKVTVKLIYPHLINPGDSARCHAVHKQQPFFSSRQRRLLFSISALRSLQAPMFFSVLEPFYQDGPQISQQLNEFRSLMNVINISA